MSDKTGFEWLAAINTTLNIGNSNPYNLADQSGCPSESYDDSYDGDYPIWEDVPYDSSEGDNNDDGFYIGEELPNNIIETITSTNITLKEYLEKAFDPKS